MFVPLACHSHFSMLDSTLSPSAIVQIAAARGLAAAALTDRNTVAGSVEFYKAAKQAGVHPVTGAEVTLARGRRITLLVESAEGYRNLCRLLTTRMPPTGDAPPPGVTTDNLARYARGLICLLGVDGDPNCDVYREIYGRNLAFALAPHNEDDLRQSRVLYAAARRLRVPSVVVPSIHYGEPGERLMHDILTAMRTLTMLGEEHPDKHPPGERHFYTEAEITRHFGHAPQAIANTALIAERCRFDFELGDILFPTFPCEQAPRLMLRKMAGEGLRRRYGANPTAAAIERLERELHVIEEVGYAEYFLIFADIVRWANARGIATLARGSAAGSLVCYTLGISNVCPFRFGLCFERFLNKERMQFAKLADIDLDLPWDKRDEVVDYVFQKYGEEHVAMIGAFNTFQGRAAVADIAKTYGLPEREVRRFTERLPHFGGDAEAVIAASPECHDLPVHDEPWRTVLSLARRFQNIPRHFTMHPCGLVISGPPITDRTPLFRGAKGLATTHYAMDDTEELGFLKMDLLGQAGLSVLREARANIRANRGLDAEAVDERDERTWTAIARGESRGVFHIESPNMVNLLVMSDCRDIECLTAMESVIRPGAANEGRKRAFARRHQGLEPVSYVHPSLEPALKETYGLLVYEEHILLVANGFAGLDWGRADTLRRLLVKNRDWPRIEALGEEFRASALRRGHKPQEADAVWHTLREFAGYMFNKAHSAAYAVEAFEGAFLKMRYPVEFLAAVLTCRRGFYSPIVYVLEALRNGARFLPPCINSSDAEKFEVSGAEIRLPVNQVKGLRAETAARIAAGKPYTDVADFFRRAQPNNAEWLALLKVGALDVFGEPRGRLFWRLSRLSARSAQTGRPGVLVEAAQPEADGSLEPNPRWETEFLGFPVSVHPLEFYAPNLNWSRYTLARDLAAKPRRYFGQNVQIAGMIVADRIHPTERGPMKFLTLADPTGFIEVSLFADTYRNYGHLTANPVVAAMALAEPFDNQRGVQLNVHRVYVPKRGTSSTAPALMAGA